MKYKLVIICFFVNACATWDRDRFHTENGKNSLIVVKDEYCLAVKNTYDKLLSEAINVRSDLLVAAKNCILNGPNEKAYFTQKQKIKEFYSFYRTTVFHTLEGKNRSENRKINSCFYAFDATGFALPIILDDVSKSFGAVIPYCSEKTQEIFENADSASSFEKDFEAYGNREFEDVTGVKSPN